MTGSALRSSVLAALVLVVAGCATQSQETVPTTLQERGVRRGDGRGGILGGSTGLDSTDPRYRDYLEHVRKRLHEKWSYPCVKTGQSCEYKSTLVEAEFGILKDGRLQYVEIVRESEFPIYDAYVVTAIKVASPFPPVPPVLMAVTPPGSTGIALRARFLYEVKGNQHLLR